jgi:hypothetical protein
VHRTSLSGVTVNLLVGKRTLSTQSDGSSLFAFQDLEPGKYQLEALLPTGAIKREVDLTNAWCARTVFAPE